MKLTKRQREILDRMATGEEFMECGLEVWIGDDDRTSHKVLFTFLRNCLVSEDNVQGSDCRYYHVNEWGLRALADPDFEPLRELLEAAHAR